VTNSEAIHLTNVQLALAQKIYLTGQTGIPPLTEYGIVGDELTVQISCIFLVTLLQYYQRYR
jgi:hypothetical protein